MLSDPQFAKNVVMPSQGRHWFLSMLLPITIAVHTASVALFCAVKINSPASHLTCFCSCKTDIHDIPVNKHRRQWIEDKLLELASIFAIDLCAYAMMHNHYHVVLFIDKDCAELWSELEVVEHWHQLFSGNTYSQRFLNDESMSVAEQANLSRSTGLWRARLMDISWFMRILNEGIARLANREDHCTGRLWEGRFSSQALIDEKALAACAAYVDLNPIRAGLAESLSDSAHTSIKRRCEQAEQAKQPNHKNQQASGLLPFVGNPRAHMPNGLPFRLNDYLALVDWTGRMLRNDKRGSIPEDVPPILVQLHIDPKHWCYLSQHFDSEFKSLVDTAYHVKAARKQFGQQWAHGIRACRAAFPT
jgi:REP element-mobilizing transposase RayT